MATPPLSRVVDHLRRVALLQEGAGLRDEQLLDSFLVGQEDAAFEALVRRHGPMVLGICRRVLHDRHDAEDAFQATFLVLIRKAASIGKRELLANWLYGVAHRTALQARKAMTRRRAKERQLEEDMAQKQVTSDEAIHEMLPLLDQELSRLPDKYRVPIILCDLEGKTTRAAAQQLNLPERTLSTRLARARVMLAKRLARHGTALSGGTLALVISQNMASASVPPSLVSSTVKIGALVVTGKTGTAGLISAKVAALTEGVVKTMLMTKLKTLAVVSFMCVIGLGLGARFLAIQALGAAQEKIERKSGQEAIAQIVDDKKKNEEDSKPGTKEVEKRMVQEVNLTQKDLTVQAQRENAAKWEYKVEALLINALNQDATKQMNDLAAKGWEYVGLVATGPMSPGSSIIQGSVAFKRLKNGSSPIPLGEIPPIPRP